MVFWWCVTLYRSTWHRSYPYITTLLRLTLLPGLITETENVELDMVNM